MRERVTVSFCLSVCLSLSLCVTFPFLEKAPFSGLKLTSVYILGEDFKSKSSSFFLKIEAILEKKRVELRP